MRNRALLIFVIVGFNIIISNNGTEILSKSKLEKCADYGNDLNCTSKIVLNLAVPTHSSGNEASIVAQLVEVQDNSSTDMRTIRKPPVITVNKSAAYALYELTYIRDVSYRPEELFVETRKCRSDAGSNIVKHCERLRDGEGHVIQNTQPTCCPCGNQRRVPSSCGNFFDKMMKGKANTAHCLRFPGVWFHVFGIGQRSLGFSIRIEVKTESKVSEVIVGPANRSVTSQDNFLRANLIGDYVGYTNIPSFEDYYLVIPRQGDPGQPQDLGRNFSMWMLLERVRFTLDGNECNKIGVGYDAFNGQPDFCSSPFWSCLHNQLWNFWEADMNRIGRNQTPLYVAEGRFQRINEHPNPGSHSFSIGITESLNSNLLIELSADDIEYVYQRSLGEIIGITVPTFEALTQFGTATITTKNIGEVEASYSLTFDCSAGVSQMEEQYFIMKRNEVTTRPFKLYPTTDQAAKYVCTAILKDAGFKEVDRAECQFTTTTTVLDNGTQTVFEPPKTGTDGFFGSIESLWSNFWSGFSDFVTGKNCRRKCSGFIDFSCHVQYICMGWLLMFCLLLSIFPTVAVLLWLLHQKGVFDPFYDWLEDHFWDEEQVYGTMKKHRHHVDVPRVHHKKHHKHDAHKKRRHIHYEHRHKHSIHGDDYNYDLHRVHKEKHKHGRNKGAVILPQIAIEGRFDDHAGHRRRKRDRETIERPIHSVDNDQDGHYKLEHELLDEKHLKPHVKQRV